MSLINGLIKKPELKRLILRLGISLSDISTYYVKMSFWSRPLGINLESSCRISGKLRVPGSIGLSPFGGAYSNHIAATAAAGQKFGFETIGLIRGEELASKVKLNPTLQKAADCGMQLVFIARTEYRRRLEHEYLGALHRRFGPCTIIPEGGSNDLAIQGVAHMVELLPKQFKLLCTPIGTGGTMAGLLSGANQAQEVWGFSALKGIDFDGQLTNFGQGVSRRIFNDYHFGGYAKANNELIEFINNFKAQTKIPLDPIYTGKMMYGLLDLLKKDPKIKDDEILVVHTGGLQGIKGFNAANRGLINIL